MRPKIAGRWFLDAKDRRMLLRGVNLGGSSKLPFFGDGEGHNPHWLDPARMVSFVGRPFPLHEADEHFRRLAGWGFNCLRFLTTWEAVEHTGPGVYDEAYLTYFEQVIKKAGDYGFHVFVDPHQDVWSRWSGGDGAPAWTLELAGFNLKTLDASEAAISMAGRYPNYGRMIWANNNRRLASGTLFTLFFAGSRFAPQMQMEGQSSQNFLQDHFIAAMQQIALRLKGMEHVLGFGPINEPSAGFIGLQNLNDPLIFNNDSPVLTGFQTLYIPAGFAAEVPLSRLEGFEPRLEGTMVLNPNRVSAWQNAQADIWRNHGVWDVDASGRPVLLQDEYFNGLQFFKDCVRPFSQRFANMLTEIEPDWAIFVEGEPGSTEGFDLPADIKAVNASHWYDLPTLMTKHYDPERGYDWFNRQHINGREQVRQTTSDQIGFLIQMSQSKQGEIPTLVSEFGLPYDLDDGKAYLTGDFSAQIEAADSYYDALDEHLVHSTQWNYTADNSNAWGDQWNQEDLSIFSRDQQTDPQDLDSGGRGLAGFVRPTLRACAGQPLLQRFERESGEFTLKIEADPELAAPTLLFVPRLQYPDGLDASVTSGTVDYDPLTQEMVWYLHEAGEQTLTIFRHPEN